MFLSLFEKDQDDFCHWKVAMGQANESTDKQEYSKSQSDIAPVLSSIAVSMSLGPLLFRMPQWQTQSSMPHRNELTMQTTIGYRMDESDIVHGDSGLRSRDEPKQFPRLDFRCEEAWLKKLVSVPIDDTVHIHIC